MANYFPLIVDAVNAQIKELPDSDNLDMANSSIVNAVSIEASGNITGNYFIGDGSLLTGIDTIQNGTSNVRVVSADGDVTIGINGVGNIAVFSSSALELTGNILPAANVTYDLGSDTQRWNDLWLSNSTIYIGNAQISATDDAIVLTNPAGGQTVLAGADPSISVTAVTATGNIAGGNITTLGQVVAVGNIDGGNITTLGQVVAVGNIDGGNITTLGQVVAVGGLVGNLTGNVTGVLLTAAQPNISSVGVLSDLTVLGNIAGNVVVVTAELSVPLINTTVDNITLQAAAGNNNVILSPTGTGIVDVSNKRITNLAEPTDATDAVTKSYVDEVAEGLKSRPATQIATTANLTATYDNGASGVGATLTATTDGAFPEIDGVTLSSTTSGQNGVLVKNQSNAAQNGRYNLTQVGDESNPWILTRCSLCDESNEIPGSFTFVKEGTVNAGTGWVQTVADPETFVIGTDAILIVQFSGAGTYKAGAGLTLTGDTFSVNQELTLTSIVKAGSSGVGNIGSVSNTFNTVFAKATSAQYADLAENYLADAEYAPGTVVSFGGSAEVTLSNFPSDNKIAGVVSTNPGFIMNSMLHGAHVATVALVGRVPCYVVGPISKGNMLVSAGNGYACACSAPAMGTVIGKALEDFTGPYGTIEVVIGRL